jgi:4a-hydroxytetrahydrobiopterin dehydratase
MLSWREERPDYLADALSLLQGWIHDNGDYRRTLAIDDTQHAAFTERIKIIADALQVRLDVRRFAGSTHIRLRADDGLHLTHGQVTLAARIEDLYRRITAPTAIC